MTATEVHAPVLGESGQPCRECGTPLAPDQRYCLHCGARRGDARLDHTVYTRATTAVAPAAPPARGGPSGSTVVASVATLVLALGVGVLIGRAGGDGNGAGKAVAPQVIRVGGGAVAAPTATTAAGAAPASPKKASKQAKGAKSDAGASSTSGGSKATNKALTNLQHLSPKEYQKQSQKLPKTVGTGGKPPPKDKKAPAGGGSFQSIG